MRSEELSRFLGLAQRIENHWCVREIGVKAKYAAAEQAFTPTRRGGHGRVDYPVTAHDLRVPLKAPVGKRRQAEQIFALDAATVITCEKTGDGDLNGFLGRRRRAVGAQLMWGLGRAVVTLGAIAMVGSAGYSVTTAILTYSISATVFVGLLFTAALVAVGRRAEEEPSPAP